MAPALGGLDQAVRVTAAGIVVLEFEGRIESSLPSAWGIPSGCRSKIALLGVKFCGWAVTFGL